ncbi:A24 family peptidase [uncultured Microbacterium sp.]|uniref:prepilin peptidase n=1 Tax=uncultured Microbacterium sp. TaxID=191216 RepID=UPI0025E69C09|nr:A24 family peptidase [uncultured Microbacterium sp.]
MPALLAAWGVLAVAGVALAVVDVRRHRLPDAVVLPALALSLALLALAAAARDEPARAHGVVGGAVLAFALFALVHGTRPSALGGGDVKLAALVGAHLGWFGVEAVASALAMASVLGGCAAMGVWLAGARRADLAYGPYLLGGACWRILQG